MSIRSPQDRGDGITISSSAGGGVLFRLFIPNQCAHVGSEAEDDSAELGEVLAGSNETHVKVNETYVDGSETYVEGNEMYVERNETYVEGNETYIGGGETYIGGGETYIGGDETYIGGDEIYIGEELVRGDNVVDELEPVNVWLRSQNKENSLDEGISNDDCDSSKAATPLGPYDTDYDWESRKVILDDGRQVFQCDSCYYTSPYKTNMQEHAVWKHELPSKFLCQVCKKYFPNSKAKMFREHMVTCTEEPLQPEDLEMLKRFPCSYCHKKYRTLTYLNVHIKYVHLRIRHIKCQHCSFRTGKNAALHRHLIRLHGYKGELKCNICSKQFHKSLKKSYLQHVRTCCQLSLSNKYPCLQCGNNFPVPSLLAMHVKRDHSNLYTHQGNSILSLPCEHCNIRFRSGRSLLLHLRKKHEIEGDGRCPTCERVFTVNLSEDGGGGGGGMMVEFERHILECTRRRDDVDQMINWFGDGEEEGYYDAPAADDIVDPVPNNVMVSA